MSFFSIKRYSYTSVIIISFYDQKNCQKSIKAATFWQFLTTAQNFQNCCTIFMQFDKLPRRFIRFQVPSTFAVQLDSFFAKISAPNLCNSIHGRYTPLQVPSLFAVQMGRCDFLSFSSKCVKTLNKHLQKKRFSCVFSRLYKLLLVTTYLVIINTNLLCKIAE